jgi:signal transduction histidine kinase
VCQPIAPQYEQILIRFAREAINNAVRHAHCRKITIHYEAQDNRVLVSVRDDGKGFDPTYVSPTKLGLKRNSPHQSEEPYLSFPRLGPAHWSVYRSL